MILAVSLSRKVAIPEDTAREIQEAVERNKVYLYLTFVDSFDCA